MHCQWQLCGCLIVNGAKAIDLHLVTCARYTMVHMCVYTPRREGEGVGGIRALSNFKNTPPTLSFGQYAKKHIDWMLDYRGGSRAGLRGSDEQPPPPPPPLWWSVTLHHHATCGQEVVLFSFLA